MRWTPTFTRKQRLLLKALNCDAGGQCAKQGHYRPWSSRNFCSDCSPGCAHSYRCESLSAANRAQVTGSAWPRGFPIGPMKLSLIPLAFLVQNAEIAEDPAFKAGRPFAQVQKLFIRPRLLPLLHHEVEIQSLQLDRPAVELIRNEQ